MDLKTLRGKTKQTDVADAIGVTRAYYTQLESGARRPSLVVALRLARFYNISVEALLPDLAAATAEKHPATQQEAKSHA